MEKTLTSFTRRSSQSCQGKIWVQILLHRRLCSGGQRTAVLPQPLEEDPPRRQTCPAPRRGRSPFLRKECKDSNLVAMGDKLANLPSSAQPCYAWSARTTTWSSWGTSWQPCPAQRRGRSTHLLRRPRT